MSHLEILRFKAEQVRKFGRKQGVSDHQIDQCIEQALESLGSSIVSCGNRRAEPDCFYYKGSWWKTLIVLFLTVTTFSILIYCTLSWHKPTQSLVSRQIQDFIYPFMRRLRLTTLTFHEWFPSITAWHEEQCLIRNPLYRNPDVGCWPCEQVRAVINLTEFQSFAVSYYQNGTPFTVKDLSSSDFSLEMLENFFTINHPALTHGTGYFECNIPGLKNPKDLFELDRSHKLYKHSKIHIEWQFKRVCAARILRRLFPRPSFVPNTTEVALERYLFIDGSLSPTYTLPLTEFANVWLGQKLGKRIVMLQPSPHCQHTCFPVSVALSAGDILFYNWQYWRPTFTSSATSLSMTYMGSFY